MAPIISRALIISPICRFAVYLRVLNKERPFPIIICQVQFLQDIDYPLRLFIGFIIGQGKMGVPYYFSTLSLLPCRPQRQKTQPATPPPSPNQSNTPTTPHHATLFAVQSGRTTASRRSSRPVAAPWPPDNRPPPPPPPPTRQRNCW